MNQSADDPAVRLMKRANAYTLIELGVAMALAGVVTVAALSSFATFSRHRVRLERATAADDIAKTVVQYLVRESQRIGGSALRPWQAIAVEQDPCGSAGGLACVSGDRVTFAFPDERAVFPGCGIETITATEIKFQSVTHESLTACCNLFHYNATNDVTLIQPSVLRNEHIMLSSTGIGGTAKEIYKAVTYADDLGGGTGTCTFKYVESGQARPLASVKDDGSRPTNLDFQSTGFIQKRGNALPIKIATAYVGCDGDCIANPQDRALYLFSDRNAGKGTTIVVDPPTSTGGGDDNFVISPNIADLQISLGYDNDEDGEVVESEDGINDDFAGNNFTSAPDNGRSVAPAASTVVVSVGGQGAAVPVAATAESASSPPNPRLLRMVRIGVISAVKVNDRAFRSRAQLPGGQVVEGQALHLRALSSKAAFRSLNLLE